MTQIKVGTVWEEKQIVTASLCADVVGSGDLPVFSTPMMLALMEKAASGCLGQFLEQSKTSVGTACDISHLCATPVGMEVIARAEIIEVDDRRIVFKVAAYDEQDLIGEGTHQRFVVDRVKFMERTMRKGTKA